ncbi:alpha/beta hydrolase [Gemmobacter denitrificans]|uniref:Alpha/beta-hydrolase family protein n=1 Tax=Gemmobacter denitrificans TaxID=3123040 RepID=A0ABU8C0B0_9RHOB
MQKVQGLVDRSLLSPLLPNGLLLGAFAFRSSLAPSLVPRTELLQGVVSGLSFALGYGFAAAILWCLRMLELVKQGQPIHLRDMWVRLALTVFLIVAGLMQVTDWQNGVRQAMQMPPLEDYRTLLVAAVALAVATILLLLGRIFRRAWLIFARMMTIALPVRAALLMGFVVASVLFWSIGSGVLGRGLINMLDASYARLDALIPTETSPPASALKSGTAGSLVSWSSLGAQGRDHMLAAPDASAITGLTGQPALEPIRVYVGVNSAKTPEQRAGLALAELQRTGAFDRGTLVIATPTGTGWIDQAASQPLEYLLHGDVATVSVQYSYLPSWLSLFVEPERGAETAQEVFRAVYGHWTALPKDRRPRLFLFGLSLGALNSDLAVDVYDIMGDPFHGALWAGPPFASRTWNVVVENRVPETPVWRPRYSDGRMFRFTTQDNFLGEGSADWGPLRIAYLQYPSDPIVFFEPGRVIAPPRIFTASRPADISPGLHWIPVVSYLQMALDMATAAGTPRGFGHVYAASDYLDAWVALLEPKGWTPAGIEQLRARLVAEGL